jgi:hypothetical protein
MHSWKDMTYDKISIRHGKLLGISNHSLCCFRLVERARQANKRKLVDRINTGHGTAMTTQLTSPHLPSSTLCKDLHRSSVFHDDGYKTQNNERDYRTELLPKTPLKTGSSQPIAIPLRTLAAT